MAACERAMGLPTTGGELPSRSVIRPRPVIIWDIGGELGHGKQRMLKHDWEYPVAETGNRDGHTVFTSARKGVAARAASHSR